MSSTRIFCESDCHCDPDECVCFKRDEPDGQPVDRLCAKALADAKTVPLREATLFRLRRLSRHLCSQAVIDPGDTEYMVPLRWVRDPPPLPCPHGRASWQMCPHCLGLNAAPCVPGEWTITRTGPA